MIAGIRNNLLALVAVLLVAACSSVSSLPPAPQNAELAAYQLGSGDRVKVTVFGQEDLSGEFELDGQGRFPMPLVGEIDGFDQSVRELENSVEARLREGQFLRNPEVSIEVLNYRPFFILGEVNQPGSYPFAAGMTVIRAVALAGGFSYRADQNDILIKRGGAEEESYRGAVTTPILPGDIIEVQERFF
ncbi:MAG: polysaccharide biosynthesis/export family protein [Geminicoccaceae bacterium]